MRAMNPEAKELVERLREACVGHPDATIPWPHRVLHEAADLITQQDARIAELEALLRRVQPAMNGYFSAGMEERDGSARRQEKLMESGDELLEEIRSVLGGKNG